MFRNPGTFIDPPGYRDSFVENLAFNAYSFHQTGIEEIINALAASDDPNDLDNQRKAFDKGRAYSIYGIEDLTQTEIEYIQNEVAKRWHS